MSLAIEHPPLPALGDHVPTVLGGEDMPLRLSIDEDEKKPHRSVSVHSLHTEREQSESLKTVLHESTKLLQLALPLVVSALSGFAVPLVQLSFIGKHLGKHELSVAVLSTSFFNVTGYSFIVGSLGALETLIGQAHGAKRHALVGVLLQRALVFTLLMCSCVALMWTQMEWIMVRLGQDPVLAKAASRFLLMNSPSLFFMASAEALKRYFACRTLVLAPAVAAVGTALVTPLLNYIFVSHLEMGLVGASIATNMSQAVPLIIFITWSVLRERRLKRIGSPERTWYGFSRESLQGWGKYFKLAVPSAAMICLEWWCYEVGLLMSGLLENPELHVAVMGLTLNLSGLFYMLPMGIGNAASVRVGNCIGAKMPRGARRSAWTAVGLTMIAQFSIGTFVVLGRDYLGGMFSDERDVLEAASKLFLLLVWCMVGDGMNSATQGAFKGLGRQKLGAYFNLVSYWVLCLPFAWLLTFKVGLGLSGIWIALSSCAMLNGIVMMSALGLYINWEDEVEAALLRGEEE